MTKRGWTALGVAVGAVLLIQLVPAEKTNPPVETEMPAPAPVRAILRRSCYDCHSNETVWPWYSRVAPVSFLLARDVQEGRRELNVSVWNRYENNRRLRKFKEIIEQVGKKEMPPTIYTVAHRAAILTPDDRKILMDWARAESAAVGKPAGP
ncbi:MAG: heme-binding domain-containing protein [Acidobacteriota bacterium]